jgi:hypothetical protein
MQIVPFFSIPGDLSSVKVPSTVAFVIFTTEYYTKGKGFILHYEGITISADPAVRIEDLPAGEQIYFSGPNGTHSPFMSGKNPGFATYVFQQSAITETIYDFTVSDFNVGVGPTSALDKVDVWGVQRGISGFSDSERLLIQPIAT